MFYEKKIKYLDYYVKQERVGNGGFVKIEVRNESCNINISINGLRSTDIQPIRVYLVSDSQESELCTLNLTQGKGMKQLLGLDARNMGSTGISYQELEAIRVPLSAERELCAIWEKPVGQVVKGVEIEAAENKMTESSEMSILKKAVQETITEEVEVRDGKERKTEIDTKEIEKKEIEKKKIDTKETEKKEIEINGIENNEIKTNEADAGATEVETITLQPETMEDETKDAEQGIKVTKTRDKTMPLYDNKWKQLWEIYPHVAPFRDEREYLSVGPNDFVILPDKYFRMANNSFLLHGYYNYKHLVLKRLERHGESRYYIGVPGNFYDREKQVAVMFGFESFESQEEPARIGDYGYYLMRIEL